METFSTDQWIILLLVLLLGWLLGLLTRSGAKWRHAYHDEEGRRKAAEARAAEAEARLLGFQWPSALVKPGASHLPTVWRWKA